MFKKTQLLATLLLCVHFTSFAQNQNMTLRAKMSFPNQTLANICGYTAAGKEYALLGASKGLIIVDITNPDLPQQIVQVPGPDNLWKEIKTYSHYAYITSEGGGGVQVVDLSNLPNTNITATNYLGDGAIQDVLGTIHALHIDTTKGYLYAYGSTLFSGGAIVLDIHTDPAHPKYVGKFDQLGYIHDGYVDNDTLYGSHIYAGLFSIVNMADKTSPQLLSTQSTPNSFTHNTWIGPDRKTLYTTDETSNSFLAAYDITDPTNIQFLDKVQSNPGSGSAVHNTHIIGNYAVTSWYRDGVTIVDIAKPNNLVQVGNYDTYPGIDGSGFDGCWGVYPFFPSGTVVTSNISGPGNNDGELHILTPNYIRAAYLEGLVTDAQTNQPLSNVQVVFEGTANGTKTSGIDGMYRTGQSAAGTYTIKFTKLGYLPYTTTANIVSAETTMLNVALEPAATVTISGLVVRDDNGDPVPFAKVGLLSNDASFDITTNDAGEFTLPGVFAGEYDIVAGAWGYQYTVLDNQTLLANQNVTFQLKKGYEDDFVFDYGWTKSGTSSTGLWERAVPVGVDVGVLLAPDEDLPDDIGNQCYVTGNNSTDVDVDDVESGAMILNSPVMDLSGYNDPIVNASFYVTSFNIMQQTLDSLTIIVTNGQSQKVVLKTPGNNPSWQTISKHIAPLIALTNTMQIKVRCYDNPNYANQDSYEAAFDGFSIVEGNPVRTQEPVTVGTVSAQPNPFGNSTQIQYTLPETGFTLLVVDLLGNIVQSTPLNAEKCSLELGQTFQLGIYFVQLVKKGFATQPVKVVKVNR